MQVMRKTSDSKIGPLVTTALLIVLTGCIGYVESTSPSPAYIGPAVVVEDDYVYYPRHQVYYSSNRRHFIYQEGRDWVTRPAPPRVSADVLFASPSVHLEFHDAPARHHTAVVRQYPRRWSPPREKPHPKEGHERDSRR